MINYIEIKKIAAEWANEIGLEEYSQWTHPFTNVVLSITQVLWSLHTERNMSLAGMRLHFDRFVDTKRQVSSQPEKTTNNTTEGKATISQPLARRNEIMETATCQVCGRLIKANTGLIAHHGYKRPYGSGWQTASCPGARYVPYEVSCERLKEIAEGVKAFFDNTQKEFATFLASPPQILIRKERVSSFSKETKNITYDKPADFSYNPKASFLSRTYAYMFDLKKIEYENEIAGLKKDIAYMEKRIEEWKPASASADQPA